jgi:hypothetical protein
MPSWRGIYRNMMSCPSSRPWSRASSDRCGVSVNFDAEDALKRLRADGLVSADEDGRLSAIAPDDARTHLDRLWDRLLDVDSLDRQAPSAGA